MSQVPIDLSPTHTPPPPREIGGGDWSIDPNFEFELEVSKITSGNASVPSTIERTLSEGSEALIDTLQALIAHGLNLPVTVCSPERF